MTKLLIMMMLERCMVQGLSLGRFRNLSIEAEQPRTPFLAPVHSERSVRLISKADCSEVFYSVGVNDGPPGKFILPHSDVGKVVKRPCVFKGIKYNEGTMAFECKESGWAFTGHDCKDKANVTEQQCKLTTHTFTLHGMPGQFLLPLSNAGAVEDRPCVFQNEKYLEGSVQFVCADGKWHQESHTCSRPASGRCPPLSFSFKLAEYRNVFKLPWGPKGSVLDESCTFSGKTYSQGVVKFACTGGAWQYTGHTCSDQPLGGCGAMNFTVTLSKRPGEFILPNVKDGQKRARPCRFSDKTYDKGVVEFSCTDGMWKYTGNNCTDQPEQKPVE